MMDFHKSRAYFINTLGFFMRRYIMSRFNNMRISKNGKLLADEWIYNKEKRKGRTVKDVDITDSALFRLHNKCILNDNVILRDILLLIKNMNTYPILSPILTQGRWLKDIVDEGLTGESGDDDSAINTIIIGWHSSIQDDIYNEDKSLFDAYINIYGKSNKKDSENYALDFMPIYKLINCAIVLDHNFIIHDERKKSLEGRYEHLVSLSKEEYYPSLFTTNHDFTLFNIIHGLFWELSFHGGPKDRDAKSAEMIETIRKINSGEEKAIPWKDIKKRLRGDNE